MSISIQPAYAGTVLRQGSRGPDVALVQTWLSGLGPARSLSVDGRYGPGTLAAVKAFQAAHGLSADGLVGRATWEALYVQYAALHGEGEVWPGITLEPGHRGATVKSAQHRLQDLLPELKADGSYGPATRDAVRSFQICARLPHDGILGKVTWHALYGKTAEAAGAAEAAVPDRPSCGCAREV